MLNNFQISQVFFFIILGGKEKLIFTLTPPLFDCPYNVVSFLYLLHIFKCTSD